MNLEEVKEHIKEEEGFSNKVYLDHLGYGTIGYGHLVKPLDNFVEGTVYDNEELEKLFPKMFLLESNHGSMAFRKANTAKIPVELLKPYHEMLGVSNKWTWHDSLVLEASNGQKIYFVHQQSSNVLQVCAAVSMNVVQGHYHTKSCIHYTSSPEKLMGAMNVGCMIDKENLAFKYSRVIVKRPVISCAVITNGIPQLVPMVLKKGGRWDGMVHV